jgi:L-ascorbate metabolism protein UlaG (beta-lactamase superfamily)
LHSGFRPPLGPTAPAIGFVLRGSRSVYFAGDTDLFDGMSDLGGPVDLALLPVWGWGPTLGRGLHMDPLRAAEALRRIRPRAAVPIHWGTYWPHAMGRVYPDRRVEPPAAFAEYASELAPDVRVLPTEVGTTVEWHA